MKRQLNKKRGKMQHANAREQEQLERMKLLSKMGRCFFCDKNYLSLGAAAEIHKSRYWYIKKNDYPYKGSVHHYLVVSKMHIVNLEDISSNALRDLLQSIRWLKRHLKVSGYSVFVRSGDLRYTGATIDHLHFHFLVGTKRKKNQKLEDNIRVTLGHQKK